MRGLYTYKDYDENTQTIYVLKEEHPHIRYISGKSYAWLFLNGFETMVDEVKPFNISSFLPHLKKIEEINIPSFLPDEYKGLELSVEDIPYAHLMLYRLDYFKTLSRYTDLEGQFRSIISSNFSEKLPHPQLSKVIRFLFDKHVTNDNRFRLLLHCGLQRYLVYSSPSRI